MEELSDFFLGLSHHFQKDIILIVDEIEGLRHSLALNLFLHTIRSMYHDRHQHHLRSVILVGVSNITGILQDTASPFNIADQIDIPYFTFAETKDLLEQHTRETGQAFLPEVIQGIYDNTAGQPGLVNALARDLVEKRCPGLPKIGMEPFYQTLDAFMRVYVDKNISNVVNKARQHPEIMKQILFDGPVNFTAYDERLSFLRVNGVIVDQEGQCAIPVPIYKKCLYQTFKPLLNGNDEVRHFKDPFVNEAVFLDAEGYLDMPLLLDRYAAYIFGRGNVIFAGEKYREGLYHYNLDAFLASYAGVFGGRVFPEVPEGGGRVDLLVLQGRQRWIIEVKRFLNMRGFEQGKRQVAAYIRRSSLTVGYLVVFSDVHAEGSKGREMVDGLEVQWWILPVRTEPPSQGLHIAVPGLFQPGFSVLAWRNGYPDFGDHGMAGDHPRHRGRQHQRRRTHGSDGRGTGPGPGYPADHRADHSAVQRPVHGCDPETAGRNGTDMPAGCAGGRALRSGPGQSVGNMAILRQPGHPDAVSPLPED